MKTVKPHKAAEVAAEVTSVSNGSRWHVHVSDIPTLYLTDEARSLRTPNSNLEKPSLSDL